MRKHNYQWTRRDHEHTKLFTLVALKNIGSQASTSTISYSGSANQQRSCWILAEAPCQNPCNMSGMRTRKASTVQEAVVRVARNNKNCLRSGPAARRGFHFQAHGDIPLAVFISQGMLRMRRTVGTAKQTVRQVASTSGDFITWTHSTDTRSLKARCGKAVLSQQPCRISPHMR
jgi:hypothetical protein